MKLRTTQDKRKIGVLVFTKHVRARAVVKSHAFQEVQYNGFKHILKEIDREQNTVSFISRKQINDVDVVLVSLTSYWDIINMINELRDIPIITAEIIVGGMGVTNIRPFMRYIDIAVFRRGEGIINDVLAGKPLENVWYKRTDPTLEWTYKIGRVKHYIGEERSVGCNEMCSFCHYCWSSRYEQKDSLDEYSSGYSDGEDSFKDLKWGKVITTAIDGMEEKTRRVINKGLSNDEIVESINNVYDCSNERKYKMKVYSIIGFPWEDKSTINMNDLRDTFERADRQKISHEVILVFHLSHFVPSILTPMFFEGVNLINYRHEIDKRYAGVEHMMYNGRNITVYSGMYTSAPSTALENCIVSRATEQDSGLIEKVLLSGTWARADSKKKCKIVNEYFPNRLYKEIEIDDPFPTDFLETPYNYRKFAHKYVERKKEILG